MQGVFELTFISEGAYDFKDGETGKDVHYPTATFVDGSDGETYRFTLAEGVKYPPLYALVRVLIELRRAPGQNLLKPRVIGMTAAPAKAVAS